MHKANAHFMNHLMHDSIYLNFGSYISMPETVLSATEKKLMQKLCKSLEGFRKKVGP